MRKLVRPVVLFALLYSLAAIGQAQTDGGAGGALGGGVNLLSFAANSPSALIGGVNVSLNIQPAPGYTCTTVTIAIVDQNGKTLATQTFNNPGATINQNFNGLGSNVAVSIDVTSTFQNGASFDFPYLEGTATTN